MRLIPINIIVISIFATSFVQTEEFTDFQNKKRPGDSEIISSQLIQQSWWWPWGDEINNNDKRNDNNDEINDNDKINDNNDENKNNNENSCDNIEIDKISEVEEDNFNPFTPQKLVGLEEKLLKKIIGQNQAIKMTVSALESYAYEVNDPYAPIASLLYVGPSGVGKTQLAKELAKIVLGSEESLIRLNMSEYSDDESVWRLIGLPRGYVNYKEGGELTEALKESPYSIVLLDEVEKASPAVLKVFFQVFDEGFISDAAGTLIDCRNVMFILTSNLESLKILTMHDLGHSNQEIIDAIEPILTTKLSPELYARLEPVIFRGLKGEVLEGVINKILCQTSEELFNKREISIDFEDSVIHFLQDHAPNYQLGARHFRLLIRQTVTQAITAAIKRRYLVKEDIAYMKFQDNHFIIQNIQKEEPFLWRFSDVKEGLRPPFKLDDLLNLENKLQQKVMGQPYAIKVTVASLIRYAAGLSNGKSPIGSFLYAGPTGVGKTELAKALTVELMGSESHLIRLDMSEYSEPHSISRLIGSPPGYINHDEGGQLTEALKRSPYAIVLLDEIEKAHPIVLKTFLQVFDEGRLSDSQGTVIDCRNVIFIATTNLASAKILTMHQNGCEEDEILENIRPVIAQHLSPELYNRLEVAAFMGLDLDLINQLILSMLKDFQIEVQTKKQINVQFGSSYIDFLRVYGYSYELGARPLKRLIQQTVVTAIAKEIIVGTLKSGDEIMIDYHNDEVIINIAS